MSERERVWACVKNGVVRNVIVSDEDFAREYQEHLANPEVNTDVNEADDHMIEVTDLEPRPGFGWFYDPPSFIAPQAPPRPDEEVSADG